MSKSKTIEGLPLLLKLSDVARELSVCRTKVWQLCRDGKLETIREGRMVRVTRRSLLAWINRRARRGIQEDDDAQTDAQTDEAEA